MDDTSKTEEQLLTLMRSLSVRIRKAEKERDFAVQQLKQLKSILDGFSPELSGKHPGSSVSPCSKHRSPVPKKTPKLSAEALLRHELSENRAYDSGLASSLTNGSEHTRDVNEKKSRQSSMTSEHGDSGSLQTTTQEDRVVRTPLKVVNHKMLDFDTGPCGGVFSKKNCVTSSETLLHTKSSLFEGLPSSTTNRLHCSSAKTGDGCTRVGSLESRIEAPTVRDSLRQSTSTGFTDPMPLTKSFLRSLAASSVTQATGEGSSGTHQVQQEDKKTRLFVAKLSDLSPLQDQKERPYFGTKTTFPTTCEPSQQQPLTHMVQRQWSNLTPFASDPPRIHTPAGVSLAPFSDADVCRCRYRERNTTSPSGFRHHTTTGKVQTSAAVKHGSPIKIDKQTSTCSSSGVTSRSWLRKLICRLVELSDNFQSPSPAHSPVVRFDCDPNSSVYPHTRSSSCSLSRSRTAVDKKYLTARRNSSPASTSTAPQSSRISRSTWSRATNRRSPSSSGVCSRTAYPLFLPVDQTSCKFKQIKSRTLDRPNTGAKSGAQRLGSVTKRKSSVLRRSPSKSRKPNLLASKTRPTPRSRSEVEMGCVTSPRIRIFDPNGEPHDCNSGILLPIQTHRVHDVPRPKVTSRLSWN
ncbi:hypothetical protein D915_006576 [Fasciola hepatica]|uniref:Uncharacterized protein n=1 Tax=Fasciola hepatica TaxID=6192 RepID=A0A4E0R6J7_FASHE|nr:hypothetical protein D915_006576 [Fasciola hepatica]